MIEFLQAFTVSLLVFVCVPLMIAYTLDYRIRRKRIGEKLAYRQSMIIGLFTGLIPTVLIFFIGNLFF